MWTDQLDKKLRELYDVVCRLEDEKYDWEMKLIRQNAEVTCLDYCNNTTCMQFYLHEILVSHNDSPVSLLAFHHTV